MHDSDLPYIVDNIITDYGIFKHSVLQEFSEMELEELLSLLRVSARSGRKVRAELQSQRKQKQQAALAEAQSKRCGVWLAGDEHGGQ